MHSRHACLQRVARSSTIRPYGQSQNLRQRQPGRCDGGGAGRRGRHWVRVLCQESASGGLEDGRRDHLPAAAVRGAGGGVRQRGADGRSPDHGRVQHPPGPIAWRGVSSLLRRTRTLGHKAIRVRDSRDLERMAAYQVSGFVLDAFVEGTPGGTGVTIDWDLAAQAQMLGPIILAGGLTPNNVLEAVRQVRPYAVDVTSGVEASPGKKDHAKVQAFITNAKSWKIGRAHV